MPKLVIFDCDGTLIDSETIANRVICTLLAEYGLLLSPAEAAAHFLGKTWRDCFLVIEKLLGRPLPSDFRERHDALAAEAFRQDLRAVEGVEIILKDLVVPKCVASNSGLAWLDLTLTLTGLHRFFHPHIFSAQQVANGKPAPDLFLFAAQEMGVDPVDCIVIEDSVAGVTAARAAGMRVFAYNPATGHGPGSEALAELGAIPFDHMDKLPQLLAQR